jgi:beta-lactamase regulating signal transducer with metallopeptidase domain
MMDLLLESALRSVALAGAVWLVLALLRVRNPRANMTAWTVVLAASLSMPVLMHRVTVTIPAAPSVGVIESLTALSDTGAALTEVRAFPVQAPSAAFSAAPPAVTAATPPPDQATTVQAGRRNPLRLEWRLPATAIYLVVAGMMLLRLVTGVLLSWRMTRAARPIHEAWAGGARVRVSDAVGAPVTFGTTVLLPTCYAGWSEAMRQAVLSHERSHVAQGDFYVLLLAAINRAVFWFNPLAWWQLARMAELAEIISDDAALETVDDRPFYAGILLDVAGGLRQAPAAVAMARVCTLGKRVERILAATAVPARMGWRRRALVALALAPAVIACAAAVTPGASKPSATSVTVAPAAPAPPADAAAAGPHPFDRYAGYYELHPLRALAVTRAGDRLVLEETGRPKFEVVEDGDGRFVAPNANAFVTFKSDAGGEVAALQINEPGARVRRAVRIDIGRAQAIENAFARWIAAAPDRFRDQAPADGSRAAVLWAIEDLQRDVPSYARMSRQLADNVRRQIASLHAMVTTLGAVDQVFFRGVGPAGYDIYGAKFASGFGEFRILVGSDGNIDDMVFRPDGDDTPGEVVTCAQEPTLKQTPGGAPIQVILYNDTGADIRAFALDGQGQRSRDVAVADERSVAILTSIGEPWIVTDTSGQCLEVVVPGRNTRALAILPDVHEQVARSSPRRTSPLPGTEQALHQYIDGLRRGEPNYDRMTPQLATFTRQDLTLDRAILAKLGPLRAMSFRGVTTNGNDVYMAYFANGWAEWRIGLVKQGRIGRIALGPHY